MPMTRIIHEIKDYYPLTVERLRQIRELSHEDKMEIIQTFDATSQGLIEFCLRPDHRDVDKKIND
jgi:hypothetical protein